MILLSLFQKLGVKQLEYDITCLILDELFLGLVPDQEKGLLLQGVSQINS